MEKNKDDKLNNLRVLELNILLQHLRLGKKHLEKYLSPMQFSELLYYNNLNNQQTSALRIDPSEKLGNLTLMINTVFTCGLGAWLGLSSFMGIGADSAIIVLPITLLTAIISGYLGYYNYKTIKLDIKNSFINQKLSNMQLHITSLVNHKNSRQVEKICEFLNRSLNYISTFNRIKATEKKSDNININLSFSFEAWLKKLDGILKDKTSQFPSLLIYQLLTKEIENSKKYLDNILAQDMHITEKNKHTIDIYIKPGSHKQNVEFNDKGDHVQFIKILTDPTRAPKTEEVKKPSWLRTNFLRLLFGLVPTILGGFGSMFVYSGGIPNIAKAFGLESIEKIIMHPLLKPFELAIAISITLYFGYTFAYSNYKSFHREQELKATQNKIANEESKMIKISSKLNLFRKIKHQTVHIVKIFKIIQALPQEHNIKTETI